MKKEEVMSCKVEMKRGCSRVEGKNEKKEKVDKDRDVRCFFFFKQKTAYEI